MILGNLLPFRHYSFDFLQPFVDKMPLMMIIKGMSHSNNVREALA